MRHFTWLLLASSALVSAQPTLTVRAPWRRGGEDCDKPIKDYFDAVGKKIARVRNREDNSSPPTCDLETVEMPVGTLMRFARSWIRQLTLPSSYTSTSSIRGSEASPRCPRSRHAELYLRRQHRPDQARGGRCCGQSLQRHLRGSRQRRLTAEAAGRGSPA